jgi:hypothetical protein
VDEFDVVGHVERGRFALGLVADAHSAVGCRNHEVQIVHKAGSRVVTVGEHDSQRPAGVRDRDRRASRLPGDHVAILLQREIDTRPQLDDGSHVDATETLVRIDNHAGRRGVGQSIGPCDDHGLQERCRRVADLTIAPQMLSDGGDGASGEGSGHARTAHVEVLRRWWERAPSGCGRAEHRRLRREDPGARGDHVRLHPSVRGRTTA